MRRFLAPAVVVVALLTPAELAGACSCILLSPRDQLDRAKAGFVGRVVKKRRVGDEQAVGPVYRYRIRVGRALKRRLGKRLLVTAPTNDGVCGFEWHQRKLVAAYLYGRPGRWQTGSCSLERPRVMRRLKRELAQESVSRPRPRRSRRSTCR